ncbi:MAG: hypothetical protein ACFBSF_00555 [Leptolyngbyaceae cyanobacterium]
MWFVALSLQALTLIHTVLWLCYRTSLRGDTLELLLVAVTAIASFWVLLKVSFQRSPRWLKTMYVLNGVGLWPLALAAVLMALGMYATHTIGSFKSPNGISVTLKEHTGLLGCSIYPYIVQNMFERHIYRSDHYIYCFTPTGSFTVKDTSWSADETKLILTVERQENESSHTDVEDYAFQLTSE